MENEWLKFNQRKIDAIQYQLTELAYKNENPTVPFPHYRSIIGAMVVEIKKLQKKINEQNAEIVSLHPELLEKKE
jgi:hypothetical protein